MLAEGVKVLSSDLETFSAKQSTLADQMNKTAQSKATECEAGGPGDEGLGRCPSPGSKSLDPNKTNNHVTVVTMNDNERLWVCGHCNKSFGSARALKIHEVKQHESSSRHFLKCGNCDEVFEHTNLLQIHMRVHHNVRLRCLRCKDMFDNPAMLRMHFKEHHSDPICLACGLKFDHDKLLRLHMEHYHKVGGKASKKDVMAFCEELSIKMAAPAGDDVITNSSSDPSPDPEGRSSPRESLGAEDKAESEESSRGNEESSDRDIETTMSDCSTDAEVGDEGGENDSVPPPESEKRYEGQHFPEETTSPSQFPLASQEIKQEQEEEASTETRFHNHEEADLSVDDTRERREKPLDVEPLPLSVEARSLQTQRPSVIATVSCSKRSGPRANNENSYSSKFSSENRTVLEKLPPTIHEERLGSTSLSLKKEPSEPCEDPQLWEEGGEAFDQDKLLVRRPAPRCNRCQQWFPSKMEYLHHLISHQDEENPAEESDSHDDTSSENNEQEPRIDFLGRKRWSVPDIRRPIAGSAGLFSELHAAKRHSVPDIRPHPVLSNRSDSPSKGVYGTVACSECMDVFFDSRSCKIHIEKCHTKPECRECGLQFDHKNLHKIHMNSYHSTVPLLQCYHCGQKFKERAAFVSHVTSHETQTSGAKSPDQGSERDDLPRDRSENIRSEISGRSSGDSGRDLKPSVNDSEVSEMDLASPRPNCQSGNDEAAGSLGSQTQGRRETRTRIFMPKFRDVPYGSRQEDVADRCVGQEFRHPDGEKHLAGEMNSAEARPERCGSDVDALVKIPMPEQPRVVGPTAESTTPVDRSGIGQVAKQAQDYKADNKRGGPPPLIPVRQATATSPESLVDDRIPAEELGRAFRSFPSHLSPPRNSAPHGPSGPFSPWRHVKVRDSASPETPKNMHMVDVQPLTKEALLKSLCLRRRASAPELTGLYRPKLAESGSRSLVVAARINEANDDKSDAKDLEAPAKSAFPASTSFRARQMAMSYQPRRSQPGDFTCQRCGIFFGHKKLLKIHLDSYHGNNQSLQCLQCNRSFDDRAKFLDHVVAHQKERDVPQKERVILYRRKHSAPEVTLRSSAAHLESLYNKAIMNSQRVGLDKTDRDLSKSEDVSSSKSGSPRSDEDLPSASRQEFVLAEGDEDSANFCFVCGKSFESGKELDQHVISHAILNKDGRYCCSLCQKTFNQHRKLEIHTRSHTGFKPHKCEYCGRCFPYYSSYYYHKMTHTDQKPHRCEVCGKGFIQMRYLRAHLKSHEEQERPSAGGVSSVTEERKDGGVASEGLVQIKIELNDHHQKFMAERIADLEKEAAAGFAEAPNCRNSSDKESSREDVAVSGVRRDVGMDTKPEPPRDEVTEADQDLESAHRVSLPDTNLDKVEVVRSKGCEPVVVLQSSANEVGTKRRLSDSEEAPKRHRSNSEDSPKGHRSDCATSKTEKRYQCKHCQKGFSSYSSLYVHTRLHTGQRPYTCKFCDKRFTHASGMKRHVRCHTGERPYPCTFCPSAFADRGALRSHIRTHTGERPYKCDLCEKTFTQSSSLRVHKKTVHMQNRGAV